MRRSAKLFSLLAPLALSTIWLSTAALGQQRLVSIGERRLFIDCAGQVAAQPVTVILITGGGGTTKNWAKVQPEIARFVRVCSYDAAGLGNSDKTAQRQSAVEMVEDLHALLEAADEKKPYILAGHSMGGLYARWFTTRYPSEVAGLLLVDSSHEEQAWRLHEIDPAGPGLSDAVARGGFIAKQGERSTWHTDVPLIVLGRGRPFPRTGQLTEAQFAAWDRIWQEMQQDLARRSPKGQYRWAANSGHMIPDDEPELVIQAVRDLIDAKVR